MFVIRRQQAIMPNHCSSSNKSFINFYGIAAPAMPFGCSASLRSLSCCLQFLLIPHGSYCVPHATSFISSFVPLHYTTFAIIPFASSLGIPLAIHTAIHKGMHQPFRKLTHKPITLSLSKCSLGFISLHYVIHSLQ